MPSVAGLTGWGLGVQLSSVVGPDRGQLYRQMCTPAVYCADCHHDTLTSVLANCCITFLTRFLLLTNLNCKTYVDRQRQTVQLQNGIMCTIFHEKIEISLNVYVTITIVSELAA